METEHEITTTPHHHVKTLAWVGCSCGERMIHPATKGLIADWVKRHTASFYPTTW